MNIEVGNIIIYFGSGKDYGIYQEVISLSDNYISTKFLSNERFGVFNCFGRNSYYITKCKIYEKIGVEYANGVPIMWDDEV